MTVYLDTSTVLNVLLGQGKPLAEWGKWTTAYSSELMGVEARRVIDRLRLTGAFDDEGVAAAHETLGKIESAVAQVLVSRPVLRRASQAMPTVVKTLDAIHLATALLLAERSEEAIVFATHDGSQAIAARAMGFATIGISAGY